jgi:hypothetical protein
MQVAARAGYVAIDAGGVAQLHSPRPPTLTRCNIRYAAFMQVAARAGYVTIDAGGFSARCPAACPPPPLSQPLQFQICSVHAGCSPRRLCGD